jgi:predicted ABC-class ATPase
MLKQNERIINMEEKRQVTLTNEEFRLIRNLLRFEYEKYELEYTKYNQPHSLNILRLIEETRRKFKLVQ